jgi:hypothetical protein
VCLLHGTSWSLTIIQVKFNLQLDIGYFQKYIKGFVVENILPDVISIVTLMGLNLNGYITRTRKMKNAYKILIGIPGEQSATKS